MRDVISYVRIRKQSEEIIIIIIIIVTAITGIMDSNNTIKNSKKGEDPSSIA
jgi:hypothetical protein